MTAPAAFAHAQAELGPTLPPRVALFALAAECEVLARRAKEFAGSGPTADLGLAQRQLDAMRSLLGGGGQG